jgi:hypothetical protein
MRENRRQDGKEMGEDRDVGAGKCRMAMEFMCTELFCVAWMGKMSKWSLFW